VWQVDSNLRRHTPTDLQNDDAHALTWAFAAPLPNFGTNSAHRNATKKRLAAPTHHLINAASSRGDSHDGGAAYPGDCRAVYDADAPWCGRSRRASSSARSRTARELSETFSSAA
jgi:hypothetical protein